jgi:glycosyltransferase involved in cell wall biosynthesis
MGSLFVIIAALTLLYLCYTLAEFYIGFNQIENLSDQPILDTASLPKISLILSALNEESGIEKALTSLVNIAYPNLEIIAINDRSTDNTAKLMDNLQKLHPILTVHHINKLPDNWFGKNHALHFASQKATGDWLLFTDADVSMKADTLTRAISYAMQHELDHLTIYEHHQRKSFWLKVSLLGSYLTYSMFMKPWRVRHAWSKKSLGHGAFNLIRKTAYQSCRGHEAIAMECLDDLSLGAILKKNGFMQDTVDGRDFIEREWYSSLPDMIGGMKKNSFAFFKYRLHAVLRDCAFAILFYLWPLCAVLFFSGFIRYLNLGNIILTALASLYVAKKFRLEKKFALLYPLSIGILIYTIFNSVLATYRNKGVIWRGTHYSLKMLRQRAIE